MKKYMIGGAAAVALGVLVFGWSYMRSMFGVAVDGVRQAAKDAEPVEMKIKRAKVLLKDIDPEMTHYRELVAREVVSLEKLGEQIQEKERFLADAESKMKSLASHLKSGASEFQFAGNTYTSAQVKADLASKLQLCTSQRNTLKALTSQLSSKKRMVDAARARIVAMQQQKEQLKAKIEMMEAKLEEVKVAETSGNIEIDGSELAGISELLDEVDTTIRVREKVAGDANVEVPGEIPVDAGSTSEEDLANQYEDYLKKGEPKDAGEPVVEEGPKT